LQKHNCWSIAKIGYTICGRNKSYHAALEFFLKTFESNLSPPQPAWLRTCAGALFASFKKYASHFLNPAYGVTEPNNAPYTGTGENSSHKINT